ncbi:MAG: hypothetical protein ACE5JR_05230 [Gemmatimonadota bacterium]
MRSPLRSRLTVLAAAGLAGCVYYNTLYNAEREYDRAERALREGRLGEANVALDSVIAKTGRVLTGHPNSKYADDAAILKARSEVYRGRWEAAYRSAELAARRTNDPALRSVARGIVGVAAFELGDPGMAREHLTQALDGKLGARDRTIFLFTRGRARLALGEADAAGADLRAAVEEAEESGLDQLELASALARVGEYEHAVALTRRMLDIDQLVDLTEPQRRLVDTLMVLAPESLDAMFTELLDAPGRRPVQRSVLYLHQGRTRERLGDDAGALAAYAAALEAAVTTRAAGEAAYRWSRLELAGARDAGTVAATLGRLQTATRVAPRAVQDSAIALTAAVELFSGLMGAYESRGAAAAEALLRSAEIARADLRSPELARGLYLRYLRLVPRSPWAAKAILGALSLSGSRADGIEGAVDLGDATDAELHRRLRELDPGDPYFLAQTRVSSVAAESAYVRSERELRRRLTDIRALFDDRVRPVVADTAEAVVDSAAHGARADSARVEF